MTVIIYDDTTNAYWPDFCVKFRTSLNSISQKDYGNKFPFDTGIESIDMDEYEKALKSGSSSFDKTMDLAMPITNEKQSVHHLKLVELRMDYKSVATLEEKSLASKESNTKALLNHNFIDQSSLFIFNENVAEPAKIWYEGIKRAHPHKYNWIMLEYKEFKNYIKKASNLPITYKYTKDKIEQTFLKSINKKDHELFCEKIDYWKEELKRNYGMELGNLKGILYSFISTLKESLNTNFNFPSDFDKSYTEEVINEFIGILKS